MPSSDYGSRAGTPGSNPASKSYAGSNYAGGVGGNKSNSLGNTGLTTSATMRGNTAFGPAGGKATGYASNTRLGSGLGPSIGSFSNFRNADGSAMFGGGLQNRAIAARNPQQAIGMLRALQMAQGGQRPSSGRVGGLLDGEQVTVGPVPSIVPMAMAYGKPAFPGALTPSQLSSLRAQWQSFPMRNPTQRPYNPATSPLTIGSAGTVGSIPPNPPVYTPWRVTTVPKSSLPSNLRPSGNTYIRVGN